MIASPSMEIQGDETPIALQRLWNLTRARLAGTSTSLPLLDEVEALETFPPAQEQVEKPKSFLPAASDVESDCEDFLNELEFQLQDHTDTILSNHTIPTWFEKQSKIVTLDAGKLGDIPAIYNVPQPASHQLPVIGVYIDPRVVTGFRYKVRPMQAVDSAPMSVKPRYLFGGKALTLQSIGRGYSRRFTFESVDSTLNDNENYFWGDSRPEGFSFEIEAVSVGDKFTVYDANHEPQGTLQVMHLQKNQVELKQEILSDGTIEKHIKMSTLCKLEWYQKDGAANLVPVSGLCIVSKARKQARACLTNVLHVAIGIKQNRKGYVLLPGVQSSSRRITVSGKKIRDVPCEYTIVGLERYELPVIGTYVDPRIIPGFHYRAKPAGSRRHMFEGQSLLLQSVGLGYGKRVSFSPAPGTLNTPDNYFYSDTHPEGVGLEPRAVHTNMKFHITANGEELGEASVFRADLPQVEEKTEYVDLPQEDRNGKSVVAVDKYIHVDVTCHVKLATTGGGSVDSQVHLMKVSGVAHLRKLPGQAQAQLLKVFNVGLDSQLNQLFAQSQTQLTFHPLP